MREECSYNIIVLGGTGAKCGEILLHMCANGYFPYEKLNILYIDSDMQNGNAQQFRNLYDTYVKCREQYRIKNSPISCFFNTKVELLTANPVRDLEYFKDMATLSGNREETSAAKALMQVLYSKEEMELKISNGFFAHPNVGAAVFAANMEKIMEEFMQRMQREKNGMKKIKIFLLGSIFGGTGASSLPTIARYLKKTLFDQSDNKNIHKQLKIGGCMVLPYFMFRYKEDEKKKKEEKETKIEADKFALKTRSALEYYKYVDQEDARKTFDELYIMGHDGSDERGYYAVAGSEQRNLPHVVELFAATSAVTFFESEMESTGHYFSVVPADDIGGESIYKGVGGYSFFFYMMRFSIVMKSLIMEELFDYREKNKLKEEAVKIPWYYDFLNGKAKAKEFEPERLYQLFASISVYCNEYIRWFSELNLDNIDRQNALSQVDYTNDTVQYLSFFTKQILFRQHQNDQIWNGNLDIGDDVAYKLYQDNLKYIRDHLQELEKVHFYTDKRSEKVDMSKIWRRICNWGFNLGTENDALFKNIVNSEDKSMESGVRNLVNAIFCACLF